MVIASAFVVALSIQSTEASQQESSLPLVYTVTGTAIDVPGGGCWYIEDCNTGTRHYFDRAQVPSWVTLLPGYSYYVEFQANPTSPCGFYDLVAAFNTSPC